MHPNAKPIPFSTSMIQAILDGRKKQTRRMITDPTALEWLKPGMFTPEVVADPANHFSKYQPGDYLWVKEQFRFKHYEDYCNLATIEYSNGQIGETVLHIRDDIKFKAWIAEKKFNWKPPMFMFKTISRITLKCTNVRAERLQDISEADAIAEGIEPVPSFDSGSGISNRQLYKNYLPAGYTEVLPIDSFASLWESINGPGSWDKNPWVWVYDFDVHTIKVFSESEIDN